MSKSYISCNWIQHGLSFENDHIEMCCLCCHKGGGHLMVKPDFNGKNSNWDEILKNKQKYIDDNKNGITHPECEGCFNLVEKQWEDDKPYINYIHFNHWTNCNCDCMYCYTAWDKQNFNKRPHYKVVPILKELFKKKLFNTDGEITFAGGEPAILDEFDDIINLFIKNHAHRITVHSSGITYSKAIEKGIKEKTLTVCLSADAGYSETYKKIKRVDKFDIFWKNVKKYAQSQRNDTDKTNVNTKYILIPEINDNKEEIDKWLELNLSSGIHSVTFDVENNYRRDMEEQNLEFPQHLIDMCAYLLDKSKEYKMQVNCYNNFRYIATANGLID